MTVLQEEQEKPQIETGPTRHAKIMRGIVTPIFGLLAIACVVFGVLNSTVWKPDNEITAAAPVNGSEYVVTDPNVLQLVDGRVNISAKSRDKKSNVCIAIGSARDVAGWIAGSKYMRVSGLSDWTTLSTMKVSAQGTADNSQNQVAFKDSDMWRTIKCNDGAVDMQVKGSNSNNAEDVVALIDFGNRKGDTVTLNWDRRNLPNFAMPLYLAGGLLAILAVLSASVFAMPPHKRRNKRAFAMVEGVGVNEGDENEVSAWVKNAETRRPATGHGAGRVTAGVAMRNIAPAVVRRRSRKRNSPSSSILWHVTWSPTSRTRLRKASRLCPNRPYLNRRQANRLLTTRRLP